MTTRTRWLSGLAVLAVGLLAVQIPVCGAPPLRLNGRLAAAVAPEKSATVWEKGKEASAGWQNKAPAVPDPAADGKTVFTQDSVFTQPKGLNPRPGLYPTLPDGIVANLGGDKSMIDYTLVVTGPFLTKRSAGTLKRGEKIPLPPNTELACLRYAVVEADGTRLTSVTALWRRYPGPHLSGNRSCNHVLAVGADGSLWSWGNNRCWQLGYRIDEVNGKTPENQELPRRVKRIKEKVVEAAASPWYSLVLTEDGGVYQFGKDRIGKEVVNGIDELMPQRITALDGCNIVKIFSHSYGGLAISADGVVWAWGKLLAGGTTKVIPLGAYDTKGRMPLRLCYQPDTYNEGIANLADFPFFYDDGSLGANKGWPGTFAEILNGRKPVDYLPTGYSFDFLALDDGSVWQRNSPRYQARSGAATPTKPFQIELGGSVPVRSGLHFDCYIMLCQDGKLWAGGRHPFGGLTNGKTDTVEPVPLMWPPDRSPVVDVAAWKNEQTPYRCFLLLCQDGTLWLSEPWHRNILPSGRVDEPPGARLMFHCCPEFKLPMGEIKP